MNFTAVSPFRPIERVHPLAKPAQTLPGTGRVFIQPAVELGLAKSMQDAVARYPELAISLPLAEEWIQEVKKYESFDTLSGGMLVAAFVTMFLTATETPTMEQVRSVVETVMAPYQNTTLPPKEQADQRTRQLADLWRYLKRIEKLRNPDS